MSLAEFSDKLGAVTPDSIRIRNTLFCASDELKSVMGSVKLEPFAVGLPLGTESKSFKPSVFLLEQLSKTTEAKAVINDEAEWLFLCGRDVFGTSILKDNPESGTLLIQNLRGENLGLAKREGNTLNNVLDRGDFLRRER